MALQHLAWTNLFWNNLDMAELNFLFALKTIPILLSLQKTEFYDKLNLLRKCNKAIKNKTSPNDHQYRGKNPLVQHKGITKRNDDSAASAALPIFDDKFHSYGVIDKALIEKTNDIDVTEETEEKAALGFPYAKKVLTSFQNLHEAQLRLDFLKNNTNESHPHFDPNANTCSILKTKTELLRYFADHYRTFQRAKPLSDSFSAKLKEITTETMKLWNNKESEIDCNARICYSSIICNSLQETVNFLTVCQRKYPLEIYFPILQSSILGFQLKNKEQDALHVVIEALNKFPGNVELLYLKAKFLFATLLCAQFRSQEDEDTKMAIEEVISAFKDFLSVAPPDHRRLPNAYYVVGFLSHMNPKVHPVSNTESLKKLEKYLGLGLEAEKNVLSCFLPQDGKEVLETMIHKLRSQLLLEGPADSSVSPRNSTSHSKPKEIETQLEAIVSPISYIQQTDPNRIDSVLMHRNAPKIIQNIIANTRKASPPRRQWNSKSKNKSILKNKKPTQDCVTGVTVQALNTQKLPSKLAGLKEIQLEEMDPLTDHVYTGRVLQNITIVEESHFNVFPSIVSVLMDSNGEFQRCTFINLDHNDDQVRKHLSFGSKLSIINPYYRLCMDGGCGIRIEDPQSIVFHSAGDEEPLCRFCLAKTPQNHCNKCKRAKYCSKQCQLYDWKILHHKLICKP